MTSSSDCSGTHAVVELAVRDEQRDGDVVDAVDRRARLDLGGREERRAHHPFHVLTALAVAHRPGRLEVAVAVLAHRGLEPVLGIVDRRVQAPCTSRTTRRRSRPAARRPSRASRGGRTRRGSPWCRRRPRRRGCRARSPGRSRCCRGSSARTTRSPGRRSTARRRPTRRPRRRWARRAGRRPPGPARRDAPSGRNRKPWISSPSKERYVTSSGSTCGIERTVAGVGASSTVRSPLPATSIRSMRGAVA